ncbi:General secretion pathway protein F [Phaeobacter sp. CECT 5382]|uniref:type II secretion system F family protein n=1 Tax=Phaeobacter sp. CECT 5382 TaxID=1712645 RepID=UPI0006DA3E74|nr:type II secretion system F family protein [Phaeobacter sp. CECT 5382]CUH89348.1 General secretion pathway protein F [Phaeobacter sp. CECT 5382]
MKAYRYIAYTSAGRRRSGTVVAETERDASAQLAEQDLFVAELQETRALASRPVSGAESKPGIGESARRLFASRRHRLSPDLQAVFTRQMAVMLGAELPVEAALEAVRTGGHSALDAVAAETRAALLDGARLSEALSQAGAGFAPYYLAALRAGETAGELAVVFNALADHLEQLGSDKAQIATALIYPGFVAAVSLLVCAILMVNVAPEIVAMFELSGRPLPPLTRAVLAVSDLIRDNALLIGAGLLFLAGFLVLVPRVPGLRLRRDRLLLRLPLVGRLMRLSAAVQYLRTLALVLGARHAVLNAADSAVEVLTIARFQTEGRAVATAVRQGENLSSALERLSFLPPVARQLIAAGEVSVRLARMSERAATLVEHRLSTERKRIAALLEPALMMLVGGLVLVIVLAVLLPIFDLQAVVAG